MIHNGLHSNAQLLAAFRKAIGELDPSFSGVERFGETLTPVMDVWALPEWALLRGETIFSRQVTAPAVAARFSSVELVNPTGSGAIAVAQFVLINAATDMQVALEPGPALGVTATRRGCVNDSRANSVGAEVSLCTLVTGDLAAGISLPQLNIIQDMQFTVPFVISPGFKLWFIATTVNVGVDFSIVWSERRLQAQEGRA